MPDTGVPDQSRLEMPEPEYRPRVAPGKPDPSMRRLALGAVGVCAVVLGGVWLLSVKGGPHAVPVIHPEARPMRIRPKNPGGMQVDGLNDALLNGGTGPEHDTLAPPPETPEPQALAAAESATSPPAGPAAPAPAAGALPAPPAVTAPAVTTPTVTAPPASAPPVSAPPAPAPAETARAPQAAPQAAAPTPDAGTGRVSVQLAALGSEAAATTEWHRLRRRLPGLLADRTPEITRFAHDGHVFWRLRTGGFADIAAATEFCARAKAAGAACAIADF